MGRIGFNFMFKIRDRVAFIDGKLLVWEKGSRIRFARVIGIREERLYKFRGQPSQALVHNDSNPSEL